MTPVIGSHLVRGGCETNTLTSIPHQHQIENLTISTKIVGQRCLISDAARVSGETFEYPTGSPVSHLGVLGWQDPPTTAGFKGLVGQPMAGLLWGFNYMPFQHKLLDQGTTPYHSADY